MHAYADLHASLNDHSSGSIGLEVVIVSRLVEQKRASFKLTCQLAQIQTVTLVNAHYTTTPSIRVALVE